MFDLNIMLSSSLNDYVNVIQHGSGGTWTLRRVMESGFRYHGTSCGVSPPVVVTLEGLKLYES